MDANQLRKNEHRNKPKRNEFGEFDRGNLRVFDEMFDPIKEEIRVAIFCDF